MSDPQQQDDRTDWLRRHAKAEDEWHAIQLEQQQILDQQEALNKRSRELMLDYISLNVDARQETGE